MIDYFGAVAKHYCAVWNTAPQIRILGKGPVHELPKGFHILEFAPRAERKMWTYATCGMSVEQVQHGVELHLFSPLQSELHVELLTVVAHYHVTGAPLGTGHTVNFGRPWLGESQSTYGLISRPYLDGPELEEFHWNERLIRCLWLIPITPAERDFKKVKGLEALEEQFEKANFDYLNPARSSVV